MIKSENKQEKQHHLGHFSSSEGEQEKRHHLEHPSSSEDEQKQQHHQQSITQPNNQATAPAPKRYRQTLNLPTSKTKTREHPPTAVPIVVKLPVPADHTPRVPGSIPVHANIFAHSKKSRTTASTP